MTRLVRSPQRIALLAIAAVAVASPAIARAAQQPPAAAAEYSELVPTSTGVESINRLSSGKAELSVVATRALNARGGRDSLALAELATLTMYGAPATTPAKSNIEALTAVQHRAGAGASVTAALGEPALVVVLALWLGAVLLPGLRRRIAEPAAVGAGEPVR